MRYSANLYIYQGQVTKYFCGTSMVMYLVFYNYSNAGPECQAMQDSVPSHELSPNKVKYCKWKDFCCNDNHPIQDGILAEVAIPLLHVH